MGKVFQGEEPSSRETLKAKVKLRLVWLVCYTERDWYDRLPGLG